jgi:N-hydroxyarylamine O-acetyltransferase
LPTTSTERAAPADEWEVDRLDLAAYLRRIGHDSDIAPTEQTLTALHRAHIDAIAFENVDVVLGRGVAVDLDSVQAKLVQRRRGGYCYEHGVLFAAVLERIGFTVNRLLARVGGDGAHARARTHMMLRVASDAGSWLADVGFGSGLLEPLPFASASPRTQGGWTFDLTATGPHSWQLRQRQGEDWVTLYGFDDQRQHPADVVMSNHFTSTYPKSPFVGQLIAVRKDTDSIRRLAGRRLTQTRPDLSTQERDLSDSEVADALRDVFGVVLTPEELAALTATLPRS